MKRIYSILFFTFLALGSSAQTPLLDDFIAEKLPFSLNAPIGITFSNRGQGFIWEKDGKVWTMNEDQLSATPLLDLAEEINTQSDHGLVSVALDPAFQSTGYFYVFYAVDRHHMLYYGTPDYDPEATITSQAAIGRIARYTADPATNFSTIIPNSRKVILGETPEDGLPILMTSHAVGTLVFGTDGSLLVTFGDGGSFTTDDDGDAEDTYHEQALEDGIIDDMHNVGSWRAMMKTIENGKLLRINPATGEGYSTNPFYNAANPRGAESRVWSMGFRNPYKFMKIPNTGSHNLIDGDPGKFLLGDVGSSQWEELNLIDKPGKWYGWPYFEGYTGKWGFTGSSAKNQEVENQLGGCTDYYRFIDLVVNKKQDGSKDKKHPCDENAKVPEDVLFVHEAPILAYSSNQWNPPAKTRVPAWDEEGVQTGLSIQDPNSGAVGAVIEGGTILPGEFNEFDHFPEEYTGKLFMGDFMGTLAMIEFDDAYNVKSLIPFLEDERGLTDIKFNPKNGQLYYVNYFTKEIVKVSFGGTLPPEIITSQTYEYGPSPLLVNFDASQTINYAEGDLSFEWTLPNGEKQSGAELDYTFVSDVPELFEVTLKVVDAEGKTRSETYQVSVNNTPPKAKITSLPDISTYSIQTVNTVLLEGEASDQEFGEEDLIYSWRVDLYHDEHYHPGPLDFRESTFAFLDPVGCGLEQYWYKVLFTVADPAGLSTTDTVEVFPYCGEVFTEIVDLTGQSADGIVELSWNATRLADVSYFEIERTTDFVFETIGRTENAATMSFTDNLPFAGKNIYRIKAFNSTGDYLYSNKLEMDVINFLDIKLLPNPVLEELKVIVDGAAIATNEEDNDVFITVYSMTGAKVLERQTIATTSELFEVRFDVQDLPAGIYVVVVDTGEHFVKSQFLKF